MDRRQVCIVGAGISGLLACKYLLEKGFNPIVLEAKSCIGGVWTKTLATTKLQSPKSVYQFSDFPWPSSVDTDFPDHNHVIQYITSYANHFDLIKHIKFNTLVQSLHYEGLPEEEMQAWHLWGGNGQPFSAKGKWKVSVKNTLTESTEEYVVEFVVLCIGRFSDVPNIPDFPPNKGPEVFRGKVIHSMDYASMDDHIAADFVRGKQVTIIGFQKSALDIAMECQEVNGKRHPCRVVYRNARWNLPDDVPWGVPLTYLYLTRFSELLVHKPGESFLLFLIAALLWPLRWLCSKFVETHVRRKLRLRKFGMVPHHSFDQEINSCMNATMPENFYEKVEEGSIVLKKAANYSFCEEGILVDGEDTPLKTDLVIFATGFSGDKKLKHIFASPTFQDLIEGSQDAIVPLYRECINPEIPQLAVIGFSESASNLMTSEMRSRWLAELLDGTFQVPSIGEMKKDVKKWDEFMKKYSGRHYRRSCIATVQIWYYDQLCKDMGWNPKRKKGFLAEMFEPYVPSDYSP